MGLGFSVLILTNFREDGENVFSVLLKGGLELFREGPWKPSQMFLLLERETGTLKISSLTRKISCGETPNPGSLLGIVGFPRVRERFPVLKCL